MPRAIRHTQINGFYHVINRGICRKPIAFDETDYRHFLRILALLKSDFKIQIWAFCLMNNHYHLLVRTPEANLSKGMKLFGQLITCHFNRRYGADGPLFKGRFKSLLVGSEAYVREVMRYIALNPVDAKLVDTPEKYSWGSYRYLIDRTESPTWIDKDEILRVFNDSRHFLKAYVSRGNEPSLQTFYNRQRYPGIIDTVTVDRAQNFNLTYREARSGS